MSDQRSDSLDRPVGELWVELSRDEKKKICDALIDRNKANVMEDFASLVQFTRDYFPQQPTASLSSLKGTLSAPVPLTLSSQPPDDRAEERENDEVLVDMSNTPRKKARKVPEKGPACRSRQRKLPIKGPGSDYVKEENELDE